jgi:hypothetical protein
VKFVHCSAFNLSLGNTWSSARFVYMLNNYTKKPRSLRGLHIQRRNIARQATWQVIINLWHHRITGFLDFFIVRISRRELWRILIWGVTSYILIEDYQRFEGTRRFRLQDENYVSVLLRHVGKILVKYKETRPIRQCSSVLSNFILCLVFANDANKFIYIYIYI